MTLSATIRRLCVLLVLLLPALARGQGGQFTQIISAAEPLPACVSATAGQTESLLWDITTSRLKVCVSNAWVDIGVNSLSSHVISVPLNCPAASASGTAYTCSTVPSITPVDGDAILFEADVASGVSPTLNVNSTSAAPIKKQGGGANLTTNDFLAGQDSLLIFDGTNWQMQGQIGNVGGSLAPCVAGGTVPCSNSVAGNTDLVVGNITGAHATIRVIDGSFNCFLADGITPCVPQLIGSKGSVAGAGNNQEGFSPNPDFLLHYYIEGKDHGAPAITRLWAGTNTYTLDAGIGAYQTGQRFCGFIPFSNTSTAPTLNVNGLGARPITKFGGFPLVPGDVLVNHFTCVQALDGTATGNVDLITPPVSGPSIAFNTVSTSGTASIGAVTMATALVIAPPPAVTLNSTNSGGTIGAGTYRGAVTYRTANGGRTTISTDTNTTVTIGGTGTITYSSPAAVPFAEGYEIWLSAAGGASSSETLQPMSGSVCATAFTDPEGVSVCPFGTNSTITSTAVGVAVPGANTAGGNTYKFSFYLNQTVLGASCAGNTTIVPNLVFTDPSGSGATTLAGATITITTNGALGFIQNAAANQIFTVRAKAGTAVQYSTTVTPGGSCSPSPAYQLYPILEQVQ